MAVVFAGFTVVVAAVFVETAAVVCVELAVAVVFAGFAVVVAAVAVEASSVSVAGGYGDEGEEEGQDEDEFVHKNFFLCCFPCPGKFNIFLFFGV